MTAAKGPQGAAALPLPGRRRRAARAAGISVALLSLEPWDTTWRRNQWFATELVAQGLVRDVRFVEPASRTPGGGAPQDVPVGISVHSPRLRLPKRLGGNRWLALRLRFGPLRGADLLWVNSPELGSHCLGRRPSVYDVTDDWREATPAGRVRRRLVRAEDRLARRSQTVVCSPVLAERWQERYGVQAHLVRNGVDAGAYAGATARRLPGAGPHLGYVGTLHSARLDVPLVCALAEQGPGTVHLVGPDVLDPASRAALRAAGVLLHPPVPSADVPSWMVSFDVLLCPHLVTPFTLSLDAIKAYEYLASGRPVVATPTSGFQDLGTQVAVADAAGFADAVSKALADPPPAAGPPPGTWGERARAFAAVLHGGLT